MERCGGTKQRAVFIYLDNSPPRSGVRTALRRAHAHAARGARNYVEKTKQTREGSRIPPQQQLFLCDSNYDSCYASRLRHVNSANTARPEPVRNPNARPWIGEAPVREGRQSWNASSFQTRRSRARRKPNPRHQRLRHHSRKLWRLQQQPQPGTTFG